MASRPNGQYRRKHFDADTRKAPTHEPLRILAKCAAMFAQSDISETQRMESFHHRSVGTMSAAQMRVSVAWMWR